MDETTLTKYLRILHDEHKLIEIGKKVVKQSLHRAAMERIGIREDDVALVIKKGERVPDSMVNEPDIIINKRGLAAADWCKAWCQGGDWGGNCWGRCEKGGLPWEGGFHVKTKYAEPTKKQLLNMLIKENFSDEEIQILHEYNFI